jgi:hypothetical protein
MTATANLQIATPATGTIDFRGWTLWLGEQIAADGTASVEHHLGALARAARLRQLTPASCDVLADCRQPEVARARAFATVVSALNAAGPVTAAGQHAA